MFKTESSTEGNFQSMTNSCVYHAGNPIQNFCQNPECLLPMCAICVGLHVQEHQTKKVFPNFCSIDEALRTVRKDLKGFCLRLQQNSQMYASDYRDKQRMQEECQKTLKNVKAKVLREIEIQFSAIQGRISQQISRFDEKIHGRYRRIEEDSQKLYEGIQTQLSSLASSQKILKTLIKYHSEHQRVKYEQLLFRLEHAVQQLKQEGANTSINPALFEMISKMGGYVIFSEFQEIVRQTRDLPLTVPSSSNGVNFSYGSKSN